ncbi:hypothetical protein HFN45_15995 [Rhizobium leguminosarum]|nr:hypothetical protein [Rhizobium leguminosarum]
MSSLLRFNSYLARNQETEAQSSGLPFNQQRLDTANTVLGLLDAREQSYADRLSDLEAVRSSLETDQGLWNRERQVLHEVIATISSTSVSTSPSTTEDNVDVVQDDRAFTPTTLLSVAGRAVLAARKQALHPGDNDASRYEQRLENTFAAFLEIVGDKPLNYYLPIHLQDFATVLARVPTNRSKLAMFAGMTLKEMGEKNSMLSPSLRRECLSETTIEGHLSEIKTIWSRATAGVHGMRDLGGYRITMPKDARPSIDRDPLATKSLNLWLKDSATPQMMRKPHKAWLPITGLLTGMRLAELVYLQKSDLVDEDGIEVFDLRRPLIILGQQVDRPLKTKTSKRIVAIHPLLREVGFVDFMKNVRSRNGFVFPHFHDANDPADAAGKQMGNWMRTLKIHETQRQVFHSLRHNAKDWFRHHAGERLADKQCGHALNGVSANYGAKILEPPEIKQLMAIPAVTNVDFSPFIPSSS